jgi:putative peptidoglycan lipid II flippase
VGASAYQLQVLASTMLASLLSVGSVSYLVYAGRIMELPLGLFAYAVSNVMLPSMSAAWARRDLNEFASLTGKSLSAVLCFTLPATIGILLLAEPITVLLFERGAFTRPDSLKAALALQMYAISLWAVGYARIQTQALYAMQEAKLVMRIVWVGLGIFVAAAFALMRPFGHAGIALALSVSSLAQMFIQALVLRRLGINSFRLLRRDAAKMLLASLLMGLALYPCLRLNFWRDGLDLMSALVMTAVVILGAGCYFGLLRLMGYRFRRA